MMKMWNEMTMSESRHAGSQSGSRHHTQHPLARDGGRPPPEWIQTPSWSTFSSTSSLSQPEPELNSHSPDQSRSSLSPHQTKGDRQDNDTSSPVPPTQEATQPSALNHHGQALANQGAIHMNPSRTDPTTIQLAILNTTRNNSTKGTTILNTATEGTRTDCLSRTNGCTILSDRTALRQMNHACCTIHKDPSEWPECEPPHHLYVQPIPESYGTADSHGANINTEALQPKCHNFETGTFSKRNSSPVQANHNQTLNDTATMMSPADNSPDDLEAILSSYYLPSAPAPRQLRTQTHKWAGELLHNILITEVEDLAGNYTQEELGTYIDSYAQTWVASWNTDSVLTACYSIADHPLPLLGTGVHPEIYPARKNYIAITTEPLRFFPEVPLPTVNPGQPWNWKIAICKARKRKHPAITAPAAHNPPSMEQPPSQQQPPSAGQVHFAPAVVNIHLPLASVDT